MKSVLVVDDCADIRGLLQLALESEGYEVHTASDGKQALATLADKTTLPGLILLDLMMPVMSGWEFLQQQKLDQRISSIPVVICSASQNSGVEDKPVLKKPLDLGTLLDVVQSHCA